MAVVRNSYHQNVDSRVTEVEKNIIALTASQKSLTENVDKVSQTLESLGKTFQTSLEKVESQISNLSGAVATGKQMNWQTAGAVFVIIAAVLGYFVKSETGPIEVKNEVMHSATDNRLNRLEARIPNIEARSAEIELFKELYLANKLK